jgi:peptidoglycan/xylan/chitin deacetylase (PgdA/CDA1 family)
VSGLYDKMFDKINKFWYCQLKIKFVIINFDDSHESDYTYAKPILDKYGFRATFFEVCNYDAFEFKSLVKGGFGL